MGKQLGIIKGQCLEDIANAIQLKAGNNRRLKPSEMAQAIRDITGNIEGLEPEVIRLGININKIEGVFEGYVTQPSESICSIEGAGRVYSIYLSNQTGKLEFADLSIAKEISPIPDTIFYLLPLVNALFCEVNPIPVKAAMAAMGFCENTLRLPLTPMEEKNEAMLLDLMRKNGINV